MTPKVGSLYSLTLYIDLLAEVCHDNVPPSGEWDMWAVSRKHDRVGHAIILQQYGLCLLNRPQA